MTAFIRIAMFSGPRNISTTMMRSFENRPDTAVYDEPYYGCYLKETGAAHPMRDDIMAAVPLSWSEAAGQLSKPPQCGARIAFEKHIAFHFTDNAPLDWIGDTRVFMLIRDPRAMVASYKNKYDDVAPIIDSYRIQRHIYDGLAAHGAPCPVIDARDVLTAPEQMLSKLCRALDIPFSDKMLSWPEGPRDSDGPWAPHWYDAVWNSTGFKPFQEKQIELPTDLEQIAEACREDYDFFHRLRLKP